MGELLDQWSSVCQSAVASTYQHITQDVDRPTPVALSRFCYQQDWSQTLRSRRLGVMVKSGVSRWSSLMIVRARCAGTLFCWNLCWFSAFDFMKNTKYDRKFTEVHMCAKNYQNRAWFDKVIAKIKWCSFLLTLYRVGQKTDQFWKYVTPVYDDVGRRSIYQNVQLFIGSKTLIWNIATFKYSLH